MAVYPRARGEAWNATTIGHLEKGLSPRSRGSLATSAVTGKIAGSIPALAGKPPFATSTSTSSAVYPRARGEAFEQGNEASFAKGLSPRSRGSPTATRGSPAGRRSIPALAGKPHSPPFMHRPAQVYPRARGEATIRWMPRAKARGLSPRSRGSPSRSGRRAPCCGSIPALAGKPSGSTLAHSFSRVYPRARGEAEGTDYSILEVDGLSPRSRGSPHAAIRRHRLGRSIPALAGKPDTMRRFAKCVRVYPRARGEAIVFRGNGRDQRGLSPRSRGSPPHLFLSRVPVRSIPALAGKPFLRWVTTL